MADMERMGFETQKDIDLEAYTYGLVGRTDITLKGIVDDFANLPLTGNTLDDAYYVRNGITNWMYIWNGAAWAKDSAWGSSGWVNYTTFPITVGNKLVKSIWVNADFIQETGINVDASDNVTGINDITTNGDANIGWDVNTTTLNTTTVNATTTNTTNLNSTNASITNLTVTNPPVWLRWKEEVPTGLVNSLNVTYTTSQTSIVSSTFVFLNGLMQKYTTDYTVAGTTITFVTAPSTWATLFVKYMY